MLSTSPSVSVCAGRTCLKIKFGGGLREGCSCAASAVQKKNKTRSRQDAYWSRVVLVLNHEMNLGNPNPYDAFGWRNERMPNNCLITKKTRFFLFYI